MEGKRTTTLMVIMCLVILSLTVDSANADCDCCISARAKACCYACIAASGSDTICKNTCCFPCTLTDSVVAKMKEMGDLTKMEEGQA
uniref:Bowman-Birk serine protease inhibitors family domain-containing protein n=1 Tax=Oryza glumipatula TaxID=40148 RepID=A0A0E0BMK9_9ORYZ